MPIDVPVPPLNANRPAAQVAGANRVLVADLTAPGVPEHSPEMQRYMRELEAWMREVEERLAALEGP